MAARQANRDNWADLLGRRTERAACTDPLRTRWHSARSPNCAIASAIAHARWKSWIIGIGCCDRF
jgi:hypothetical protein